MAKAINPRDSEANAEILKEGAKAAPKAAPVQKSDDPDTDALKDPVTDTQPSTNQAESSNAEGVKAAEEKAKEDAAEAKFQAENEEKKSLVKKFGADYVQAVKANGQQTTFTRTAWNFLKTGRDGTKEGWREAVKVPEEVAELLAKRSQENKLGQ